MIQLRNATLALGTYVIFNNLSLSIQAQQRIGLVGRNGAGKSTLLKVIAGLMHLDGGEVAIEKGKKIAYMPQEVTLLSTKCVFDEAFSVFDTFTQLHSEMLKLEHLLAVNAGNLDLEVFERYEAIQEQLRYFDFSAARARTERILKGLGFTTVMQEQVVTQLSIGWRMRLVLAKLLLQEADFYLFDEPTNHLDIVTKEWFFNFLKDSRFGFLLVSHDRYYLDNVCNYIYELERGNGTIFSGNFSAYIVQKEQQRVIKQAAYERQQKEISRKQATINRFRASATKARMAQSMIKQLEKVELIEVEPPLPTISLQFPSTVRSGSVVLTLKNVKHVFGDKIIFNHINGEVQRGEKIALIAPNGTGKTTLFNLMTGKYLLQQGAITFGHNVHYAIFEQDQLAVLNPQNTIYQEISNSCFNIPETLIRSFLGSFLFSGDTINKKIDVLSGGERNRVAMIKVLLQKANLLLLDEPTNHLDLYAKDVLLQALQQYDGTILIVSHDHDFLNKLATRILELTPTHLYSYPGNYEMYKEYKKQDEKSNNTQLKESRNLKNSDESVKLSKPSGKELFLAHKEVTALETKIARLEKEIKRINNLFVKYQYGTRDYQDAVEQLKIYQTRLEEAMQQWEVFQCKLDQNK